MAVLVEPVLAAHPDVVGGPKPDAEGELECGTSKPAACRIRVVPAEKSARNTTVGLQGTHGLPELNAQCDREEPRVFGRQ